MKRWTSVGAAMLVAGFVAMPSISLAKTPNAPGATISAQPDTTGPATRQEPQQPATPPTQPPTTSPQQPQPTEPTTPTQPPATSPAPADPAGTQAKADPEAAKRALTAARDSLAQMTQLPAAQALSGEPRAQVSQLISSFNELITTNNDWKSAYAKVDSNLTALIGSQGADESAAPTAAPATAPPSPTTPPSSTTPPPSTTAPSTGTAGAVGTSGTTTGSLDPAIKAKLGEFRMHLKEFQKAAGGSAEKEK
jgi:hypothetical protein